jgi:cytochrome b561
MSENASALPAQPTPKRYHPALVALHWIILILIFATAYLVLAEGEGRRGFGFTIAGLPTIDIHMILGLTVLVLMIIRLVTRLVTRHPEWATAGNRFFDVVGVLTHWGLYLFTFAITITGLILALQTNRLSRIFSPSTAAAGGFTFSQSQSGRAFPPGGFQPGQAPSGGEFRRGADRPGGFEGGRLGEGRGFSLGAFHGLSWILLLLLLVVHVGAALYHQFLRRDGLFGRMWFGKRYA